MHPISLVSDVDFDKNVVSVLGTPHEPSMFSVAPLLLAL